MISCSSRRRTWVPIGPDRRRSSSEQPGRCHRRTIRPLSAGSYALSSVLTPSNRSDHRRSALTVVMSVEYHRPVCPARCQLQEKGDMCQKFDYYDYTNRCQHFTIHSQLNIEHPSQLLCVTDSQPAPSMCTETSVYHAVDVVDVEVHRPPLEASSVQM